VLLESSRILRSKAGKGSAQSTSQGRFGKMLVVTQVALSLLLLVGGLVCSHADQSSNSPTGFDQQNVMLFRVDPATTGYKGAQFAPLMREVEEKVMALP
jgi:hypothetical protein